MGFRASAMLARVFWRLRSACKHGEINLGIKLVPLIYIYIFFPGLFFIFFFFGSFMVVCGLGFGVGVLYRVFGVGVFS